MCTNSSTGEEFQNVVVTMQYVSEPKHLCSDNDTLLVLHITSINKESCTPLSGFLQVRSGSERAEAWKQNLELAVAFHFLPQEGDRLCSMLPRKRERGFETGSKQQHRASCAFLPTATVLRKAGLARAKRQPHVLDHVV